MAKDVSQTIQDSRRAAMAFLDSAKKRENARNNRTGAASPAERTASFNERFNAREYQRAKQAGGDMLDRYWKEEKVRQDNANTRRADAKAADDFLRAGRADEERRAGVESGFDLAQKIRSMSDEDFDKAVASGELTPEQIRKAGEYEYDVYMGDVWTENPDNDDVPEPTYDEFMADPAKYGHEEDPEWPLHLDRYNPARYGNK